jgi:ribonucleotide reductase beta subunit family protein with ferritin-like domain
MSQLEPILNPENSRFTVFPIQYKSVWDSYEKQLACFWKAQEIDFSKDHTDFMAMSSDEQQFIKMILAIFSSLDGIINLNLGERFMRDVQIMEAKIAYAFQMMMEGIHGTVYSMMLDNIIRDSLEKNRLFNAIKEIQSVKMISDWAFKWIDSSESFAKRLIAFAFIEGVLFSGAFACIFWIKKYKGDQFLQGLVRSNTLISRDEGLHTDFACELYALLKNKLSIDDVKNIIDDGVKVTKIFMSDTLPCRLIGMNSDMMNSYIEYTADRLIVSLGYNKIYNKENPFTFMNTIGMDSKINFFETRSFDYQDSHVFNASKGTIQITDDF